MRSLKFLPEAEGDFSETFAWYEEQRVGLGYEFLDDLHDLLQRITRTPRLYPVAARRTYRAQMDRFPYGILFVMEGGGILVTGILHVRRDPRRWSDRVRDRSCDPHVSAGMPVARVA